MWVRILEHMLDTPSPRSWGCLHTLTPPSPLYATDGFDRRFEWFKHCTMKLSETMKEIGIEPLWKGRARSNQRLEKQRLIYHALA